MNENFIERARQHFNALINALQAEISPASC